MRLRNNTRKMYVGTRLQNALVMAEEGYIPSSREIALRILRKRPDVFQKQYPGRSMEDVALEMAKKLHQGDQGAAVGVVVYSKMLVPTYHAKGWDSVNREGGLVLSLEVPRDMIEPMPHSDPNQVRRSPQIWQSKTMIGLAYLVAVYMTPCARERSQSVELAFKGYCPKFCDLK